MAAAVGRNVVVSGVSCAVSTPTTTSLSGRESCVRVSLGRPGAATLPCSSGRRIDSWRISAQPSVRWEVRSSRNGAVNLGLSVDNDVAVLATRNAFQVHNVEKQTSATAKLSESESLLTKKSQEVALRSQEGILIFLVGMMASGKPTVGRIVADALKYKFSDSDDVVERYEKGQPVSAVFVEEGETEFRELEVHLV